MLYKNIWQLDTTLKHATLGCYTGSYSILISHNVHTSYGYTKSYTRMPHKSIQHMNTRQEHTRPGCYNGSCIT